MEQRILNIGLPVHWHSPGSQLKRVLRGPQAQQGDILSSCAISHSRGAQKEDVDQRSARQTKGKEVRNGYVEEVAKYEEPKEWPILYSR